MKWLPLLPLVFSGCPMPDEVIKAPLGRISEPSHNVAPQGALLEADNCVIRSPGVVSPVPDLTQISPSDGIQEIGAWQISPQFNNGTQPEQLCHLSSGTGGQQGVHKASDLNSELTYLAPDGSSDSVEYYDHGDGLTMSPMYLARENLYVGDKRGVYKWSSTDDTALVRVWDVEPPVVATSTSATTPTWLDNGNHVAYTAIAVFEDANGVITRSAPGARLQGINSSGSQQSLDVKCFLTDALYDHPNLSAIEVYRTAQLASSVALPNSHGLVLTLDPADFSAEGDLWTVTVNDALDDAQRGAAPYTDSSQGGLEAGNIAPPEHLFHASFKGHEFWGNVTERFLWAEAKFDSFGDLQVTTNTTYTDSSASVTVASATGLEVGMLVWTSTGTPFPFDTYVTAISGTTVTLSNAASGSGSSSFFYYPSAYVLFADGSSDRVSLTPYGRNGADFLRHVGMFGTSLADANDPYAFRVRIATANRPGRDGDAQLWVNQNNVTTTVADLATASGAPTTGGTAPAQSVHKRRLYWSKFQEPEHTTLANYVDVGGAGDIVGLAALRDALLILKTDGVYRLTGSNGSWRVDPVDTDVALIGGRSTQVMGNAVYTLGNRGFLRITSSGVENLTDGVVGDWFTEQEDGDTRARIENVRAYMRNNDGYHPPGLFAAADPYHREYVAMVDGESAPGEDGVKSQMLVFNGLTGSFTTWALDESGNYGISCLGYATGDYSSTGVQSPGIVVARKVSAVDTSVALFIMDNTEAAKAAGYTTYTQNIRFRARTAGDSTHLKQWIEVVWDTDGAGPPAGTVTALFQDGEQGADVSQTVTGSSSAEEIRIWPPLAVSRSTGLVMGLSGVALTVYGARLSFVSSGRGVPL